MTENLHEDEILIMNFLDGQLSPDERRVFAARLGAEPELREKLERLGVAIKAAREFGMQKKIGSIHEEMMKAYRAQDPVYQPKGLKKSTIYAIAAVLIFLLVLAGIRTYQYLNLSSADLYAEAYVEYDASASRAGENKSTTIEEAYRQRKYKDIVSEIKQNQNLTPKDSLLAGIAFIKQGQPGPAIEWLQGISSVNPYRQDAEFYLTMAYLKIKNYDEAIEWANKIKSDPGHPYAKQFPDDFMDKLESIKSR